MTRRDLFLLLAIGLVSFGTATGRADDKPAGKGEILLEFQIVTPRLGVNQLTAQRWGAYFRDQGEVVQVREPLPGDKVEATEQSRGTFRLVKIMAQLDRDGTLHVPGNKKFQLADRVALQEWLDELHTYGAQGDPTGQPLWGLGERRFKEIYAELAAPVQSPLQGKSLDEALKVLTPPKALPVVLHRSTTEYLLRQEQLLVAEEVQGLSLGTALAGVLVQYGLGFRPLRTPADRIELVVEPLETLKDPWPVGWDVDAQTPRNELAPALYEIVKTGFDGIPRETAIQQIATQTGVPIIIDRPACLARKIDLTKAASYPSKQTGWALILQGVVRQAGMTYSLRHDEGGRPVVFVAPFDPTAGQRP